MNKEITYHSVRFVWDEEKETDVYTARHIHFADAITVFDDWTRYEERDERHSTFFEERFKTIGTAVVNGVPMVITVVYMVHDDDVIRIITAWKATAEEVKKNKG